MASEQNTDWIEWTGGECPVADTAEVDVRFDDNVEIGGMSAGFWKGDGTDGDPNWWSGDQVVGHNIVAYRAVSA
jgi:hypothetical protein